VSLAPTAIDLRHLGRKGVVASWRTDDALIDCGPETCLPELLAALGDWRPRRLLLTHIHLDHAGAAGALVQRWPDLEVWVHRAGARHLHSPERLVSSARRVFGADFDRLWGAMTPVPEGNLHALDGGERVGMFDVMASPGHANHHVSYVSDDLGVAFTGDVTGIRLDGGPVLPPTPPPDIDLDRWRQSIAELEHRAPPRLALPHFGLIDDLGEHLALLREELAVVETLAAQHDEAGFVAALRQRLSARCSPEQLADYARAAPFTHDYLGLRRWLDRRDAAR
jgi:glyoxylase-like metal-dependent hydrolase (beta-lactamase superfamily II)